MKLKVKIALCVLLAVFAVISLTAVLGSLGVIPVSAAGQSYMLREYDGFIGVFSPADAETPMTVTDIRVRALPLGDQIELRAGVNVSDYGAVVRLLEDYGT